MLRSQLVCLALAARASLGHAVAAVVRALRFTAVTRSDRDDALVPGSSETVFTDFTPI